MSDIPFIIPESLASYVVQYEASPEKTIKRLKKQLKKRGPDPIGYFVLGWFYHKSGVHKKAIECALTAKNFAPGSPFMANLHYFFSHPQLFDAWQSTSPHSRPVKAGSGASTGPIPDLDRLIQKLSSMKSPRLQNKEMPLSGAGSTLSTGSDEVDDIVSETLAKIHEEQGKIEAAIKTYRKLLSQKTEKKEHYEKQIARLQEVKKNREKDA